MPNHVAASARLELCPVCLSTGRLFNQRAAAASVAGVQQEGRGGVGVCNITMVGGEGGWFGRNFVVDDGRLPTNPCICKYLGIVRSTVLVRKVSFVTDM